MLLEELLGPRTVLDTNVLLNAVHNPTGLAYRAVALLSSNRVSSYVPEYAREEAARSQNRKALHTPIIPERHWIGVERFLSEHGIIIAPPPAISSLKGINAKDEPVVRVAAMLGASLLTDDLDLIAECRAIGIVAEQPWAVLKTHAGPDELSPLEKIVRMVPWALEGGYFFARVRPGSWSANPPSQRFLVADLGTGGQLGYRGNDHAWFYSLPSAGEVTIRMQVLDADYYVVAQAQRLRRGVQLMLRVRSPDGRTETRPASFPGAPDALATSGPISVAHSLLGDCHWNGYIQDAVAGPGTIGKGVLGVLAEQQLSPNPYDDDRLVDRLKQPILEVPTLILSRGLVLP